MLNGNLTGGCCGAAPAFCAGCADAGVSRRGFLALAAAAPARAGAAKDPARQPVIRLPLRVQPVFVFRKLQPKQAASWRFSAEIYDDRVVAEEQGRIKQELEALRQKADFPLEILPLVAVANKEQAAAVAADSCDALLMYAAARNADVLETLAKPGKWNLIFVRHRSGPVYYMYIGVHGHYLRKTRDRISEQAVGIEDVVVDDYNDVLWRLRAFSGLKNTIGKRIVTIGTPGGWGAEGRLAPERARERWKLEILSVSYADLERRIRAANQDQALMRRARDQAAA